MLKVGVQHRGCRRGLGGRLHQGSIHHKGMAGVPVAAGQPLTCHTCLL